jgi:protein-S-isoprenylcysteine O-methyltransferase Ste14
MGRVTAIRFLGLYVPVIAAFLLFFLRPQGKRIFPASLMGMAWSLPGLLAIQLLNLEFGWWQFHAQGGLFRGMPIDLYLGWAVLWGIVPLLCFRETRTFWIAVVFFAVDLVAMPLCAPVLVLGQRWLIGELVAVCFVLAPALFFARWTLHETQLKARTAFQIVAFGGIFLFLVPEVVFALRPGRGWDALLSTPSGLLSGELQCVALLAILGVSAVQEFALRGDGTPIPFDPPKRLVVSGLYRYISNPMQLSGALVMSAWGGVLRNFWLVVAGVMSFLYSFGIANWDEGEDMEVRFGRPWQEYRKNVRAWIPQMKPWYVLDQLPARLYIAESCSPCSQLRNWFEARGVFALEIVAAEDHPTHDLFRITYDPMDGSDSEDGMRAFARGLEHINLGWAFVGAVVRLPGISHVTQILMDVSGLGPQLIPRRSAAHPSPDPASSYHLLQAAEQSAASPPAPETQYSQC